MANLLDWLGGVGAQINPFDNGETYDSYMKKRQQAQTQRPQTPSVAPRPQQVGGASVRPLTPQASPVPRINQAQISQNSVINNNMSELDKFNNMDVFGQRKRLDELKGLANRTQFNSQADVDNRNWAQQQVKDIEEKGKKKGGNLVTFLQDSIAGGLSAYNTAGQGIAELLHEADGGAQRDRDLRTQQNALDTQLIRHYGDLIKNGDPGQQARAKQALAKLGQQINVQNESNAARDAELINRVDPVKNAAALGQIGLDVISGGTISQLAKGGVKAAAAPGANKFINAFNQVVAPQGIKQGVRSGAGLGAAYGALGTAEQNGANATPVDYIQGTALGALTGGALGGVIPALGHIARPVVNNLKATTQAQKLVNADNISAQFAHDASTQAVMNDKRIINANQNVQRFQQQAQELMNNGFSPNSPDVRKLTNDAQKWSGMRDDLAQKIYNDQYGKNFERGKQQAATQQRKQSLQDIKQATVEANKALRQELPIGNTLGGPLAKGYKDAQTAGRVFDGVDGPTAAPSTPASKVPGQGSRSSAAEIPVPPRKQPQAGYTKSNGELKKAIDPLPYDHNFTPEQARQYVDSQVKAQKAETKAPLKQRVGDKVAQLKHALLDDAVAHERYIKDKGVKAELREGVDRVRNSSMTAKQFIEDNGIKQLGKMSTKDLNEFQQYLIAKRSMELKERKIATGRSHDMDMALIKSVGNKYAAQEKIVRDYTKAMLDHSVDAGLISKPLRDSLLRDNPSYVPMNRVMDEVNANGGQTSRQLGSISKQSVVQKIEGSERIVQNPIESLMTNTERMINEAARNKVATQLGGIKTVAERVLKDGDKVRPGYDTLSYLDNGQKVRVEVPALVAREMRNLNSVLPDWAETTMKVVGAPTKLLRSGATSANPIFALSNVVRDQLQTTITGNVRANFRGTPKAFLAAFDPGKKGAALRAELRRNGIIGSEYRQTYGFKSGQLMKELQAGNQLPRQTWERLKHPIDALADLIGTTENFTRAQQFYGTEGSITKRAQAARNNTLNFSRAGAVTRQLNRVIPFLNAGVQGGRITVKSLRERPFRTSAAFATFTGLALAARAMNSTQNQELYDRLSDEEKKNNLIVFTPDAKYNPDTNRVDGIVKVPMPQMLYPFLDAANNVKGKPEELWRIAGDIFTATSGVDATNPINQLTPTTVKPFVEAGLNKNLYTGQDLVSQYESNLSPDEQGKKYSSGVARGIASKTGVAAPVVDSFIANYGGGLAKDTAALFDNPDNAKDGIKSFGGGLKRRFASSSVTSQYDIQAGNAKQYKDELKNNATFKALSSDDQKKVLDKIDSDTRAIAGIAAKTEQNKSDEIKKDLSKRQKNLVENGFNADSYIKDATSKSTSQQVEINAKTPKTSAEVLTKYNDMDSDAREKWFNTENDAEYKYNLAKFENDKLNGKVTSAQEITKKRSLYKEKIGSNYSKNVRDLYSVNESDLTDWLAVDEQGIDKKKIAEDLYAYDRALYDAGLISSMKYKGGIGARGRSGRGGRKSSGSKSSGITEGKALVSLTSQMNKVGVPKTDTEAKLPTSKKAVAKKAALKKYTVAKASVSKDTKIKTSKA